MTSGDSLLDGSTRDSPTLAAHNGGAATPAGPSAWGGRPHISLWPGGKPPDARLRAAANSPESRTLPPDQDALRFFEQLARRKLAQWMLGYLAMAWVLLQLTNVLSDIWDWSLSLQRIVSLVLGLGVFPALVVSWYHGERGRQQVNTLEIGMLITLIACSSTLIWAIFHGPPGS